MTNLLIKPHLTEKTMATTSNSGFTFEVITSATKSQIKDIVTKTFGVHVIRVTTRTTHVPSRTSNVRRTKTSEGLVKYATVYLKKGESISLFEFKDTAKAGQE